MKFTNALFVAASIFLLHSCKKESKAPTATALDVVITTDNITDSDAPGLYRNSPVAGYTKLVLQPGEGVGQDAWIDWNAVDPNYANNNSGTIDQFKILTWTISGVLTKSRSLIKFTELSQIPASAQYVAAKLFLYGLASSPIHLPQGNSYYPGSPYNSYGDNSVYVQRITSSWDESTVTWNTQPSSTVSGASVIPPSTSQWNYNAAVDVSNIVIPMVKDPSKNNGFKLKFTTEKIYRSMGFYSSEYTDATKHPNLVVIYKN